MAVPFKQAWTVASYVIGKKFARRETLSAGDDAGTAYALQSCMRRLRKDSISRAHFAARIDARAVLQRRSTNAARRWSAFPAGEPLMHPEIVQIVEGLLSARSTFILCTNAILLEEKLNEFTPSTYLTFSIHMDGPKKEHDIAVCKDGVYAWR